MTPTEVTGGAQAEAETNMPKPNLAKTHMVTTNISDMPLPKPNTWDTGSPQDGRSGPPSPLPQLAKRVAS